MRYCWIDRERMQERRFYDKAHSRVNIFREVLSLTTDLKLARFPRSLAATHRGFTFYVADPSAPFTDYTDDEDDE